ncbi:CAP domain-containing protein [Corallococcus aberystwythensis]|uniref:CAP domain-containing protein n=1 Tax=Corallococcus aberystwythensis TaxID=2316722 RepID=A0A3A8Q2C3_9BACT|nr:CAP domain-containing protein [Corallococcus aberystwythensis]RKH61601.1 CAP domain-containing protein [Corallococcus aberystwythensis]
MRGVLLGLLLAGASAGAQAPAVVSVPVPVPDAGALPVPAETPQAQEARARLHVQREFERVGRRAPSSDKALEAAARRLAREALAEFTTGAPDLRTLTEAVSDSGAADPSPKVLVIRAWVHAHAIETFLARTDFNDERVSHFGVGVAFLGERAALVLLTADRKAEVLPFSRMLAKAGTEKRVCGRLVPPLLSPQVFVTRPDGEVEGVNLSRAPTGTNGFCALVTFATPGSYTVEVVGHGNAGPEVASLFLVQVGARTARGGQEAQREPTTLAEARTALYERINTLRRAHKLPELTPDATLEDVSLRYSTRMATEGFFAHIAPDGSTLTRRLPEGTRYVRAGENLGLAAGPLAAHFGIEHSPGHRKNLMDPAFRFMGVGVAFQKVDGRDQAIVTEVFTAASPGASLPADPVSDVYEALSRQRATLKLPPLVRSEALEQLAREHARRALAQDEPAAGNGDPSPLHERVFSALPDAGTASVDFFVVGDPNAVPESRSLATATNTRVGVGLVRGNSKRFGQGQYWVAVIYAAVP